MELDAEQDVHDYSETTNNNNNKKYLLLTGGLVFLLVCLGVFALFFFAPWEDDQTELQKKYSKSVTEILNLAMKDTEGFKDLTTMVNTFGARMTGYQAINDASEWAKEKLAADGFENVHFEECLVPGWKHNPAGDLLTMTAPFEKNMAVLPLGFSLSANKLKGKVNVLTSFEDLETVDVNGTIVVWNVPFTTYGATNTYRSNGARRAGEKGAIASLTRSIASYSLYTPHTGIQNAASIPAAAISVEDAELLGYIQNELKKPIEIELTLDTSDDQGKEKVPGQNIIAELPGNDPENDEILVIGGHIDSWDVGTGAHDDAGGIWHCWEAMRILKNNEFIPRRTIRLVMWTSEENGGAGNKAYYEAHKYELNQTVFALESDYGTLTPVKWAFQGNKDGMETVQQIADMMKPTLNMEVVRGSAGVDVSPIISKGGFPGVGLEVEGDVPNKYFWYHHSNADTIDHIDEDDFRQCVGAVASMVYVIADMEETLPRNPSKVT